jgi:hypothetical protein
MFTQSASSLRPLLEYAAHAGHSPGSVMNDMPFSYNYYMGGWKSPDYPHQIIQPSMLPNWMYPVAPGTNPYGIEENNWNCIRSHGPIFFDSAALGQYVSLVLPGQNHTFADPVRYFDVKSGVYEWRRSPDDGLYRPYFDDVPVVNLHVHSKYLAIFSSRLADHPSRPFLPTQKRS